MDSAKNFFRLQLPPYSRTAISLPLKRTVHLIAARCQNACFHGPVPESGTSLSATFALDACPCHLHSLQSPLIDVPPSATYNCTVAVSRATWRYFRSYSAIAISRYLRSTYIHAFVGGDKTKLIERLDKLYHESGYLDRPAQQLESFSARHQPAVYKNTPNAEKVLRAEGRFHSERPMRVGPERNGEQRQFHHALMICDILASIELATKATIRLRYIGCDEILAKAPGATRNASAPLQFPVSIAHVFSWGRRERVDLRLAPDGLFGLEYGSAGAKSYRFFALEADRATILVSRKNLRQSSYLRKILGYREILARKLYKTHLGIPNLIVPAVASSEPHMHNIVRLAGEICEDTLAKTFLFKTIPRSSEPVQDMLSAPWHRPRRDPCDIGTP